VTAAFSLQPSAFSLAFSLLAPSVAMAQAALPEIELRPGLVITRSARVAPKIYRLGAPASLDSAAIVIRGDGLTVDFAGATLEGAAPGAAPDQGAGVAIRIEGGRNVTVRNARIRGYKIGILARDVRGLTLTGHDASHNWKPRLYSLIEHESLVDWLSYHQNDKDEWYRYGAAIYLSGVRGGEVRGNTAVQGMNGLLMTRSDSLRVQDNIFSFNSGLGIGLYRSSDNLIVNNELEFNVRGYSHGFYRRGQDSAALLLYEQSNRNIVAWNSATHSGDGLFLWAGQTTMDSGAGGSNDNVIYANDFSWAPTNAMEATFSRNSFLANLAVGSEYGLWGGYSFESKIIGNCFGKNRFGIAIEHGQDNLIAGNRFDGDSLAIRLWGDSIQPSDWGYPKHRNTRSRDYRIEKNVFGGTRITVQAANTSGLRLAGNDSLPVTGAGCRIGALPPEYAALRPVLPEGSDRIPLTLLAQRDRSAMIVDEWGPYDWKSPRLWPVDSTRAVPLRLAVLGPAGEWRVVERRGVDRLSADSGSIGDTLSVTPAVPGDWAITLENTGGPTVSPRGEARTAGTPYRFGFSRFEPATRWATRFFTWTDSTEIAKGPEVFSRMAGAAPLLTRELSRLDFQWYRPRISELPIEHWGLEATTAVDLPAGSYRIRTISDDGIRVWVDGTLVIQRWSTHESTVDQAALPGGRHDLRVQYYQNGGWTELRVEIAKSP
jgi:parallel beta-helix repeat protein